MLDRRNIEAFHVALLSALRLPRGQYAIKGGLNLRLFHGSPRVSEGLDIDVDARAPAPITLRNAVDRVLAGKPFTRRLQRAGLTIARVSRPNARVSRPKQTDTVQRWKVQRLAATRPLHTKIEFSRCGLGDGIEMGFIDPEVIRGHGMATSLPLAHHGAQAAFTQKLEALAGRAEPQARDVFDLHLLLQAAPVNVKLSAKRRALALERAMAMDFTVFRSQVLAYLPPDLAQQYDDADVWDAIVLAVVTEIEGVRP